MLIELVTLEILCHTLLAILGRDTDGQSGQVSESKNFLGRIIGISTSDTLRNLRCHYCDRRNVHVNR